MPTATEIQSEILASIGDTGKNAIFVLLIPVATTEGVLTISVAGSETDDIAYNAAPAAMQAELEALDTVGSGNVVVTGQKKGPYYIEFVGDLAYQPIETPTADGAGLTPAAGLTPTIYQEPVGPRYAAMVQQKWSDYASVTPLELRRAWVRWSLLEMECGRLRLAVQEANGQEQYNRSQQYTQTARERDAVRARIDALTAQGAASANNSPRHGETKSHYDARQLFQATRSGLNRR